MAVPIPTRKPEPPPAGGDPLGLLSGMPTSSTAMSQGSASAYAVMSNPFVTGGADATAHGTWARTVSGVAPWLALAVVLGLIVSR